MKIFDQKGRLFGLVNIVDLLVSLAVILAVLAIGVKLFAAPLKEAVAPNSQMTTVLRIRGASEFVQEEIQRNVLEGKSLVSGNSYVDATIVDVKIEEYAVQTITDEEEIITLIDPVKKDIVVTIESEVPKGTATPKIGNQEIRAGRTMILKTKDFEMNALIQTVIIDE